MCKKLLMILVCVLIAGCSKKPSAAKPLKSMTIEQVRQLVFEWNRGKLPEQQVEGADEIRKELEVLEKQLKEQETKDSKQLDILRVQISKQKADCENEVHLLRKQYEAEAAESLKQLRLLREKKEEAFREYGKISSKYNGTPEEERRWAAIKEEYEAAKKAWKAQLDLQSQHSPLSYNKRLDLCSKKCKEQWEPAEEKYGVLKEQFRVQQQEFYNKNISPLKKRLAPDESVETFYKVFGKPKDKSLIGDNYYFQYRCKDGLVVLEIYASLFDNDEVVIRDVSVL